MPPTRPDDRRIGAHLPLGDGMIRAVERASAIGARAIQVFADNPTAWRRRSTPPRELPAFRACLDELDIRPVAIHASYLINLAGPDEEFRQRSIDLLASELSVAPGFGARHVNVHIGSHKQSGLEDGIGRVGDGVATVLGMVEPGPDAAIVVLENSAGGGGGIGTTIAELARVLESIVRAGGDGDRVGFCLDTAHLWGAGHDLDRPDAIDALLGEFDQEIGLARLVLIHLNDSAADRGSRADRHAHLGAGRIGERGLRHILTTPLLAGATYILETPGMDDSFDAINIERAHRIAAGEPLDPLPTESGHERGRHVRAGPPDDTTA